ncbi:NAD-dependent epimerase/dehydratase family protein [bacterium]|nr:NAD-dependent epimerase/dehydratase family protein [bacterium]
MNILVTGGAGFIGSHIVDEYLKLGHHVVIVDNLSSGKEENINPDAVFYNYDICDLDSLEKVFEKENIDCVNHLAAQMDVTRSVKNPAYDADVNIKGGINVLEMCVKYNVKKIIYSSTGGAVYGEPEFLPCDEFHPIKPISHYGLSKFTFEEYIKLYDRLYALNFTILRYPNVYGPRQNPHGEAGVNAIFILKMISGETPVIYGDGSCERDYLYIRDVVRANAMMLEHGNRNIYNLGTGIGTSVNEVFSLIQTNLNFHGDPVYKDLRKGEILRTFLNSDKIFKEFGWKAETSFEQGIQETIDWFCCAVKGTY